MAKIRNTKNYGQILKDRKKHLAKIRTEKTMAKIRKTEKNYGKN